MGRPITIIGGGLAGLSLGIHLRRLSVPTTVWEAGFYPRHRVCGEFISGHGQRSLERLGLMEPLRKAGAIPALTTRFFSLRYGSRVRAMPEPALSISRYALDALLAKQFRELGGELRLGERWSAAPAAEGVVRAGGRRPQPVSDGWRWFGLKVHARNIRLSADLEMHLSDFCYVGMSRLQGGEVNICGLFRRPANGAAEAGPADWREMFRGIPGSLRHERLAEAVFDEDSFCSVAGLCLSSHRAADSEECRIGDALTMIPPVTGNGMSMAFESAELAAELLAGYSRGEISWTEARRAIARKCDDRFRRRLRWAGYLQRLMFMPPMRDILVSGVPRWPGLWRLLVNLTR
jgi:flavin-dependent dehydrogenase